jgi:4-carboxymuconolactone decarboxylase
VPAIPLAPLPDDVEEHVAQLGAKQVNLYRCLAHAPDLLLQHSPYEWHQHRRMAREAGATDNEELARHFDEQQRVELTVTAAFYAMVPRVLDALGVPIEER